MSIVKSIWAMAAFARSTRVSAQLVFVSNFPIQKEVKAQTPTTTSTEQIAQDAA